MIKKYRLIVVGILVIMLVGAISQSASAEDQQKMAAPFSWNGVYAGLHVGYGWGNADTTITPLPSAAQFVNLAPQTQKLSPDGILEGVQIGYNLQKGIFVVGVETDFSLTNMKATKTSSPIIQNNGTPFPGAGNNISVSQKTDWFGTLRLRAGVAPDPKLLLYATGGLAYGRVIYSANTDFRPIGTEQYQAYVSKNKAGWTAGAGTEYALNSKWSVKTEYLYYDLGSQSVTANPSIPNPPFQVTYKWKTSAHTVNFGVNYRF